MKNRLQRIVSFLFIKLLDIPCELFKEHKKGLFRDENVVDTAEVFGFSRVAKLCGADPPRDFLHRE